MDAAPAGPWYNGTMKLACTGNALMDVVAFVDAGLPASLGLVPGSTEHADPGRIERVLAALEDPFSTAGGGAANTARVFVALGGRAAFAGSVGGDGQGRAFARDLGAAGVELELQECGRPTGVFCALIDRDGRRSVIVDPGAASALSPDLIPDSFFDPGAVLYADGYLATVPGRLEAVVERARAAGMKVALDLGGHRLATANADLFRDLVARHCDWTFMNEDEFAAFSGLGMEAGLERLSAEARGTLVVKRAEEGAACWVDGRLVESPVRSIRALDDTGAGDAFAAGFLLAALSGAPVERCLRLGNRVAEHAIQVPGMALDRERLRRAADALR